MHREEVVFTAGAGSCAAWLYRPWDRNAAFTTSPIIVMGHGLGGTRDQRLDAFAEQFTTHGYSCLVFDYRGFGNSPGNPRAVIDIARQLEDWRGALRFARALPRQDEAAVVLWGTSFGGGHVITVAAEDGGIAAVVAQCPFTDGLASATATSVTSTAKLTIAGVVDRVGSWFGRPPVMIPTAGRPGSLALMTAPDSVGGVRSLLSDPTDPVPRVAARFALDIVRHRPGLVTDRVRCPILFSICEQDSVAPALPTQRYATRAPRAEVTLHDTGHFDIYTGADFDRNVADQLDFLQRHVPA
ncbi:alpha/beta hydrolase [Rhodococcus sp. NPDC057297]|uniref:alpha/beta hydrolase n=1 Tax=Rhodococcus sp. NPDC057297 TaxID=3346090 RepID=UPI003626F8FD